MRLFVPVLAAIAAVSLALAQDADAIDCAALIERFEMVETFPETLIDGTADGCSFSDIAISLDSTVRYKIATLSFTAPGIDERLAQNLPPETLELEARGVRVVPKVDDPLYEYILELQTEGFDVDIAYEMDAETGAFTLLDASLQGEGNGRIALSGSASGVTDAAIASTLAGTPPAVTVDAVSLVVEERSLFTSFIAVPLIASLPSGDDPRGQIKSYQKNFISIVDSWPEGTIDAESRDILASFIEEFPRPTGTYRVDVDFATGFSPLTLMFADPLTILRNPPTMTIAASRP